LLRFDVSQKHSGRPFFLVTLSAYALSLALALRNISAFEASPPILVWVLAYPGTPRVPARLGMVAQPLLLVCAAAAVGLYLAECGALLAYTEVEQEPGPSRKDVAAWLRKFIALLLMRLREFRTRLGPRSFRATLFAYWLRGLALVVSVMALRMVLAIYAVRLTLRYLIYGLAWAPLVLACWSDVRAEQRVPPSGNGAASPRARRPASPRPASPRRRPRRSPRRSVATPASPRRSERLASQ